MFITFFVILFFENVILKNKITKKFFLSAKAYKVCHCL